MNAYEVHYRYEAEGRKPAKGYAVVLGESVEAVSAAFREVYPDSPGVSYKVNKVIVSSMDPLYHV